MGKRRNLPSRFDPDLLMVWGIVALIAFIGIAAAGIYAGTISNLITERTPSPFTSGLGK